MRASKIRVLFGVWAALPIVMAPGGPIPSQNVDSDPRNRWEDPTELTLDLDRIDDGVVETCTLVGAVTWTEGEERVRTRLAGESSPGSDGEGAGVVLAVGDFRGRLMCTGDRGVIERMHEGRARLISGRPTELRIPDCQLVAHTDGSASRTTSSSEPMDSDVLEVAGSARCTFQEMRAPMRFAGVFLARMPRARTR